MQLIILRMYNINIYCSLNLDEQSLILIIKKKHKSLNKINIELFSFCSIYKFLETKY